MGAGMALRGAGGRRMHPRSGVGRDVLHMHTRPRRQQLGDGQQAGGSGSIISPRKRTTIKARSTHQARDAARWNAVVARLGLRVVE